MSDVLMFYDENGYNEQLAKCEVILAKVQEYVDGYNSLGLVAVLETADLPSFFSSPIPFLTTRITEGKDLSLDGLSLDPLKVFELIEKPAGYDSLVSNITGFNQWHMAERVNHERGLPVLNWSDFEMSDSETVVIKAAILTALQNSHKIFATTDRQKEVFTEVSNLVESLNAIQDARGITEHLIPAEKIVSEFVKQKQSDRFRFDVNAGAIKRLL